MSIPILTFFNNKGGVGKTTLAYHLAWMFGEMRLRVLAIDLDPQANLTSAFLDEDQLVNIWEESREKPNTIFRCIQPLLEVGDIHDADCVKITREISLIPGDLFCRHPVGCRPLFPARFTQSRPNAEKLAISVEQTPG